MKHSDVLKDLQRAAASNNILKFEPPGVFFLPPPTGVQSLPVRQCFDAGQRLLQKTRGQEVAQHGQPELHEKVHQALERRMVHAGHHPEGRTLK